jgi:hypothetical protein
VNASTQDRSGTGFADAHGPFVAIDVAIDVAFTVAFTMAFTNRTRTDACTLARHREYSDCFLFDHPRATVAGPARTTRIGGTACTDR